MFAMAPFSPIEPRQRSREGVVSGSCRNVPPRLGACRTSSRRFRDTFVAPVGVGCMTAAAPSIPDRRQERLEFPPLALIRQGCVGSAHDRRAAADRRICSARFARSSPSIQALCSLRRRALARRHARRLRFSTSIGPRASAPFCLSRARSPPAPPHGRNAFWRPSFMSTSAPCPAPPWPLPVDTPGAARCAQGSLGCSVGRRCGRRETSAPS